MTTNFNPMNKEFQDECKRLGLSGYELRRKNEKEGKSIKKEIYKDGRGKSRSKTHTEEELLDHLRQFYEENGRPPTTEDFNNNPIYPSHSTYKRKYGSWSNALKLVGLDVDTMVVNGIIETNDQKCRYAEIKIINHFTQHPVDLAGENKNSPCDGICPNGKIYDVKSSKLIYDRECYNFGTNNKYKDEIEIYYFLAFNDENYKKLDYGWRVPGEIVEKDNFQVGLSSGYEFNIENMKEYDITDKFRDIIKS